MNETDNDWRPVWAAIDARRVDLGWSWTRLYDECGVSQRTLKLMRDDGQPIKSDAKVTVMARALGWSSDSIDAILAGGQPSVTEVSRPDDDVLRRVAELERQVVRLGQRLEDLSGAFEDPQASRSRVAE